ncbi:class II aldolase/adducin family protein [Alicyclobacillus fastidiosus]|uniref:Class II aldolase/adducin family protein n=1 Tax=Alicyclobacillus fastidiosus TaxID=392011 RepID=A0ABY6ZC49_9BACL|nr:class II aldolase/adducin family protein [Alicyclobacillus fastidiosus]WAH40113.1 class II aldolase/adducin family protein [Alicyclobacillus fastidiosus]
MNERVKLAETVRLFEALDLFDMNGHVSLRTEGGFFTHGRQAARATLTVNDIIKVDWDAAVLEGNHEPPNEVYIHSEIYRVRPDINAIAHFHAHWTNILSLAGVPIRPVSSVTCGLGTQIPVYHDPDSISTRERGQAVAACLRDRKVVVLRAHGAIVTGQTLEEVLVASKYLEVNSNRQVFARLLNPNAALSADEIERVGKSIWIQKNIEKSWMYYYERAKRDGHLYGVMEESAIEPTGRHGRVR